MWSINVLVYNIFEHSKLRLSFCVHWSHIYNMHVPITRVVGGGGVVIRVFTTISLTMVFTTISFPTENGSNNTMTITDLEAILHEIGQIWPKSCYSAWKKTRQLRSICPKSAKTDHWLERWGQSVTVLLIVYSWSFYCILARLFFSLH